METDNDLDLAYEKLTAAGHIVPSTVSEIDGLPFADFSALKTDVLSGSARIERFKIEMLPNMVSIVGSARDRFILNAGLVILYGGIIVSLALAVFVSWWFLIGLPITFLVGRSLVKEAYNVAVLTAATTNERAFCFLYFCGQVGVNIPSSGDYYYKKDA